MKCRGREGTGEWHSCFVRILWFFCDFSFLGFGDFGGFLEFYGGAVVGKFEGT